MSRLATVMRVSWTSLRRDRAALLLTFALPLIFFTVFASVFAELDSTDPGLMKVGLVSQSSGVFSDELARVLGESEALELRALHYFFREKPMLLHERLCESPSCM